MRDTVRASGVESVPEGKEKRKREEENKLLEGGGLHRQVERGRSEKVH